MRTWLNMLSGRHFILLITLSIFSYCLTYLLNNDFWQDEIYTLEHFIFVPLKTTLFDYHSTNNHIAFNVVVSLFARVFGMKNTFDALEMPYLLRLFPLIFSLLGLVFFYRGLNKHYGHSFAELGVSIWCTSIVFIDFGVQLRGYSLSIFLTVLQYFVFLDMMKGNISILRLLSFTLLTALSLLCLPTNIYIALFYLIFCFIIFLAPDVSHFFFNRKVPAKDVLLIGSSGAIISLAILLYYRFLLQLQPENPLISSFDLFSIKNLIQAFAVFYHFSDCRYYFYLLLFVWLILFYKTFSIRSYSNIYFPLVCFFIPFLVFYVHGTIIVQRTFLSIFPFFVIIVTAAIENSILKGFKNRINYNYLFAVNALCLIISFVTLLKGSKQNNSLSQHMHDLRNHYYLVNFNAKEATLLAKELTSRKNVKLYVSDDFGETGIFYYLYHYHVQYEKFSGQLNDNQVNVILANNKREMEIALHKRNIPFIRLLDKDRQYNFYILQKQNF